MQKKKGVSVNGKPAVSKTATVGSIPTTPASSFEIGLNSNPISQYILKGKFVKIGKPQRI